MADFRKWFLVLAVLALVVVPASAQITCTQNPGQPPTIRDGGLAELVGDVVLVCSGAAPIGTPAGVTTVSASIQVSLNPATVSNRVTTGNTALECPTSIACVTDALAFVTDVIGNTRPMPAGQSSTNYQGPIVGLLQSNLAQGDTPVSRNSILFPNITLPYGTTTIIRIANIRVVAPPASNSAQVAQVFENISTIPFGAWAITNPTQTVAQVLPPLQFSVRACDDSAGAVANFRQCISQSAKTTTFNVKYTEGFQFAFKMRGDATQCVLGTSYFSESGYTFPSATVGCPSWATIQPKAVGGTNASVIPTGLADSGTKLIIKFSNIPAGVSIWVSNTQVQAGTSGTGSGATFTPWISAALDNASGTSTTTNCSKANSPDQNVTASLVTISGGAGTAQWSITNIVQGVAVAQKSVSFAVVVSYTSDTTHGLPGLTGTTPGSVAGELGPVSNPPVNFASTSAAIPRFVDNPFTGSAFTIVPCVSTLLYPFVTNKAGFDTGIAIINTSLDNAGGGQPYNTPTQHGTCTVYYFDGTTSAPAPQVTADIAPGAMSAFSLQTGGVPNSTSSAQNFQGYVIAKCNFQFAHGYAYIVDRQSALGSQGYLALVIPDLGQTTRTPDPFNCATGNASCNTGSGEQLTN